MLVIATFSVASMVSAYASAGSTATPRSFSVVIADDTSQNALSTFIGAFIFSIVALIALTNDYYEKAGRFSLFVITILVFVVVILTFVRWVDSIARLGRLGSIIEKVEETTAEAFRRRRADPTLGGMPASVGWHGGQAIYGESIGYVQRIDVPSLQAFAERTHARIMVTALPGTFTAPGRAIAHVVADSEEQAAGKGSPITLEEAARSFTVGRERLFDEDPRFGLIVLSEIASRALSPAVNDPGTAISVIGSLLRLMTLWCEPSDPGTTPSPVHDRVALPEVALGDLFDDAFSAIARDGAGTLEVVVRLQKALASLDSTGDAHVRHHARRHARLVLARAEKALDLPEDLAVARAATAFALAA